MKKHPDIRKRRPNDLLGRKDFHSKEWEKGSNVIFEVNTLSKHFIILPVIDYMLTVSNES